jgi:membrane-bound metal-dependent hydrolase YbcI (DUF457 family)
MLAGAAGGGLAYYFGCKLLGMEPDWTGALFFAGAGAAVACLPDILEPATHPNHRAFLHGLALNGAMVVGLRRVWCNPALRPDQKILGVALGVAYLSHPILDALTPQGLPLLG